jgi:putative transposase
MARPRREIVPGAIYHLFSRGSNRNAIFVFDGDRTDFLVCLKRVVERYELALLAYCLMPNHYHLIAQTPDARLSRAMKELNGRYALRFNRRYVRDAHVFKNRFGAVLLEAEPQFLWTCGYVVMNPVRAGLCATPEEWPWSSYRASVGLEKAPGFLARDRLLSYFGGDADGAPMEYAKQVEACR